MSVRDDNQLPLGTDELKQCRICLDNNNPDDIISPCLCSGGSAFVHRQCLNNWRAVNTRGKGFKFCDICQFEYVIETVLNDPKDERERLLKYHFYVIRDSIALILLVLSIILGVALILKAIDRKSENIKSLYPSSMNEFSIYYLSAFIILLAVVGAVAVITFFCVSGGNGIFNTNNRGSTSRNSSGNSSTTGLFTGVIVIVIVCALIGFVVGIIASVIVLRKIMKHHASKLWLRQEADKYIVKDFQRQRSELEKYRQSPQ